MNLLVLPSKPCFRRVGRTRRFVIMAQDDRKAEQRRYWDETGAAYSQWIVEAQLMRGLHERFADAVLENFANAGPVEVLDVAAASGEPALSIARALPEAHVVSTDLGDSFCELGRARAAQAGLGGRVEFRVADAEDLQGFGDASMDVVTCSLGLMLFPAYPRALAEFYRVLKPGGLLAATVWHSMARIPFMSTLREFCEELEPGAGGEGPAAGKFGDTAAELLREIEQAGFKQVAREDLDIAFALPAEVWWEAMQQMPFPIRKVLSKVKAQESPEALQAAQQKLRRLLGDRGYFQPDGSVCVPGNMCHFITARK